MADVDLPSDDPALAAIARHALHDEELIAGFAAEDLEDTAEAERARALVDRCPTCRELHADIRSLRSAIRASGSAAERASTLRAPRDFRLGAEDAARLRPGSPVRRIAVRLGWRARFGNGVTAFGRPLGAAMATFGLVGLLVGTMALGSAPLTTMGSGGATSTTPGMDQAGAPEATGVRAEFSPRSSAKDGTVAGPIRDTGTGEGATRMIVLGGSAVLLVVGLGLIVAARARPSAIAPQTGN